MVEENVFRSVITFLDKLGVYDVILPFLLIFTIMFAILEKTKVLGVDKFDGKVITKKNLNAMMAFVVSFLVIASTKLVAVINETMSHVVLLLILVVSFMLLVGVFFGSQEFTLESYPGWTKFFMILMFIGIVTIFLNALDWLKYILFLFSSWNTEWASTIILFIIVISFMVFITWEKKPNTESKRE